MYATKGFLSSISTRQKILLDGLKRRKSLNHVLKASVDELEKGLVDADLGNGLIKKRIARKGQGKRGGHRVILAFKQHDRIIFMFGFSKNDRENIDSEEKHIYKQLGAIYLNANINDLKKLCVENKLIEVNYE